MEKIVLLPKAFNELRYWAEADKNILVKIFLTHQRHSTQSIFGNRQTRTVKA